THEEILRLHIRDIVAEDEITRVQPEVSKLRQDEPVMSTWKVKRKDGSFFYGEVTAKLMPDGRLLGILRDITGRRQAEGRLRESEERFRKTFEHTGVPTLLAGGDCRFVRVNAAFCRMLGYPEPEMLGMSMRDITHPDDLAVSVANTESARAGEVPSFQMEKR